MDWVAYKHQKYISHSSGDQEPKSKATAQLSLGEASLPGLVSTFFSLCPHMGEGAEGASGASFIEALTPLSDSQRPCLLIPSFGGLGFQLESCGDTNIYTMAHFKVCDH